MGTRTLGLDGVIQFTSTHFCGPKQAREEFNLLLSLRRDPSGIETDRHAGNDQEERMLSNALEGMKDGVMSFQGLDEAHSYGWVTRLVCGLADLVRVIPALPLTAGRLWKSYSASQRLSFSIYKWVSEAQSVTGAGLPWDSPRVSASRHGPWHMSGGQVCSLLPSRHPCLGLGDSPDGEDTERHSRRRAQPGSHEHARTTRETARGVLGGLGCGGEAAGLVWGSSGAPDATIRRAE